MNISVGMKTLFLRVSISASCVISELSLFSNLLKTSHHSEEERAGRGGQSDQNDALKSSETLNYTCTSYHVRQTNS